MKYNDNGTIKEINVKASDTLPVGSIVDYDGTEVPSGWEEVEDPEKYFQKQEEYSINKNATEGAFMPGVITGAGKSIKFSLPVFPKSMKNVNSFGLNGRITIRTISGTYIYQNTPIDNIPDVDITVRKDNDYLLSMFMANSNGFDAPNNTPLIVSLVSFTITFS